MIKGWQDELFDYYSELGFLTRADNNMRYITYEFGQWDGKYSDGFGKIKIYPDDRIRFEYKMDENGEVITEINETPRWFQEICRNTFEIRGKLKGRW